MIACLVYGRCAGNPSGPSSATISSGGAATGGSRPRPPRSRSAGRSPRPSPKPLVPGLEVPTQPAGGHSWPQSAGYPALPCGSPSRWVGLARGSRRLCCLAAGVQRFWHGAGAPAKAGDGNGPGPARGDGVRPHAQTCAIATARWSPALSYRSPRLTRRPEGDQNPAATGLTRQCDKEILRQEASPTRLIGNMYRSRLIC